MDPDTRSPAGTTLRYREVLSPSVSPFKRTHAYDAVDDLGRMTVRDPSMRPLRVGEIPSGWARERIVRFTGDVHVELSATAPTPIPSVAGEQAVLSFRTEPEVPVGFFRDSANNLFVRAESSRTVHLSYVLAAPEHAFAAPDGAVPNYAPGSSALRGSEPEPAVPSFLAALHTRVLTHVNARRDAPLRPTLDTLIGHFRNYRDAELPASPEGNLYLRLALGGVGACRHRAYAFALTLHALGVPARYVGNEAHAWAEVYLAGTGWTRVDLGGWDVPLRDDGAPRARFVPRNPDPFPWAPNRASGYSTGVASAPPDPRHRDRRHPEEPPNGGLGPGREVIAQDTPPENPSQSVGSRTGAASTARGGGTSAVSSEGHVERTGLGEASDDPDVLAGSDGNRGAKHGTILRLLSVQSAEARGGRGVVRGTLLECSGDARDETGAAVANLPMILELVRGRHVVAMMGSGRRTLSLGTTITNDVGRFEARVMLPLEIDAGTYSIRARTPGDANHARAQVE